MRISDWSSDVCSSDLVLGLAACASPDVRLYDGAVRPAAQIAVVTMPEQLEVASINGVEVAAAQGMWNKGDKRLELLPGRYQMLVFYRESWDSGSDQDGLRSDPALFTIAAPATPHYRIAFQPPFRPHALPTHTP